MKLYPHQIEALEQTKEHNHVASIAGYEGLYEVDEDGNVFSCITTNSRRKGKLKQEIKNGYLSVNLYKYGKQKHRYVHRLVAETFLDNPNQFKYVNHINCNKHDNRVCNLEWCSQSENIKHAVNNMLENQYETFVDGKRYVSMKEASLNVFGKHHVIQRARYSKGNEFVHKGHKVKVVMPLCQR